MMNIVDKSGLQCLLYVIFCQAVSNAGCFSLSEAVADFNKLQKPLLTAVTISLPV